MVRLALLAGALAAAAPSAARADDAPDYFARPTGSTDAVKLRQGRSRTCHQRRLIAGLAAGAAVSAVVGLYFHLDSRRIASDLAADHPLDVRWTDARQDAYDRGQLDGTLAIVAYAVAAGLVGGTVAAVILTDPGSELVDVPTRRVRPLARVVPGGGTVGASWSW